jgi:DNA-binding HxlR family transcriptional regulator
MKNRAESATPRHVAAALDLFGRRWVLRVLWELRQGPLGFRALQSRCGGMSPTILSRRLDELKEARLVVGADDGHALAPLGKDLVEALAPLQRWSQRWSRATDR